MTTFTCGQDLNDILHRLFSGEEVTQEELQAHSGGLRAFAEVVTHSIARPAIECTIIANENDSIKATFEDYGDLPKGGFSEAFANIESMLDLTTPLLEDEQES